jgi:hypothetical protein
VRQLQQEIEKNNTIASDLELNPEGIDVVFNLLQKKLIACKMN